MRRKAFFPPHIAGIEVLPTLTPEDIKRGQDALELEFWRRIIPPITAQEWAAARAKREAAYA